MKIIEYAIVIFVFCLAVIYFRIDIYNMIHAILDWVIGIL